MSSIIRVVRNVVMGFFQISYDGTKNSILVTLRCVGEVSTRIFITAFLIAGFHALIMNQPTGLMNIPLYGDFAINLKSILAEKVSVPVVLLGLLVSIFMFGCFFDAFSFKANLGVKSKRTVKFLASTGVLFALLSILVPTKSEAVLVSFVHADQLSFLFSKQEFDLRWVDLFCLGLIVNMFFSIYFKDIPFALSSSLVERQLQLFEVERKTSGLKKLLDDSEKSYEKLFEENTNLKIALEAQNLSAEVSKLPVRR